MNSITVDLGKGTFRLRKSGRYIGVRLKDQSSKAKTPQLLAKKKLTHQWLGGFRVYSVGGGTKKLNAFLDKVRAHEEVALGTHVYFREGGKKPILPTGKILLTFDPTSKIKDRNSLLKSLKIKVVKKRSAYTWIVEITKGSPNPMKSAAMLKKSVLVTHATPYFDSPMTFHDEVDAPSDDLFLDQWYLNNQGGQQNDPKGKFVKGSDMSVPAAWKLLGNRGSSEVRVAIIDLGFDLEHPDFQGKIEAPFSLFNSERIPERGIDTHGTSCAGLAIAKSNGSGIIGVAPNAKFFPVEGTTHGADSLEFVLDHCISNGADIISCSWGSIEPEHQLSAEHISVIANAAKNGRNGKGCILLFSVGNENAEHINHYANHPDVIAVAGSTSADEHFVVSNRGRGISVCAPGGNFALVTTRASWDLGQPVPAGFPDGFRFWRDGIERGTSGRYKHFEGTSASCPLVAGVCALILSAHPDLKAAEVKDILESTADKIGSDNEYTDGYSLRFGYGRVNAERAVAEAMRRKNPFVDLPDNDDDQTKGLFKFTAEVQPAKGFGVQVGLFKVYGNVLKRTAILQRRFREPIIVHITRHGNEVAYRMILGEFRLKSKANKLFKKVKAAGIESFVVNLAAL
ncbi:MAG: S8 family serine peptidase [Bacteroidota bacterium]